MVVKPNPKGHKEEMWPAKEIKEENRSSIPEAKCRKYF